MTVQQGNVITKQMRRQIYVGMRRYQVESILGSPILVDTFNNNRYNYVYTLQKKGRLVEKYKLTILFQDDKVIKIIDGH
ncbi:MAG: outer membrane protein assembly factor BamE [Coxiellaceae bacterium]|nr:outer membrane protein assembly factor BamE [Coxiellaceae bacterium]